MNLSSADNKNQDYRVFTTMFDRVVHANDLSSVLDALSMADEAALEQAWHTLQMGLLPWKTQLQIASVDAAARIRSRLADDERADTVVCLLLDQSGSMRGQKMLFTAASADIAQEFLRTLGFACEVLGFTTSKWKGGRSRRRWRWRLWPGRPGRLNDLLHIIYRSADDSRTSTGIWAFRQMLRPDLPKENIDGEALLWAARRLRASPQRRKHLIVMSDGAPVDNSTILENGPDYLPDHLRIVVRDISEAGDIRISAIGLGYDAGEFYPVQKKVDAPSDLGAALIAMLEQTLTATN